MDANKRQLTLSQALSQSDNAIQQTERLIDKQARILRGLRQTQVSTPAIENAIKETSAMQEDLKKSLVKLKSIHAGIVQELMDTSY